MSLVNTLNKFVQVSKGST